MKIGIFGDTGFLGKTFKKEINKHYSDIKILGYNRRNNISLIDKPESALKQDIPDVIVNCIGKSDTRWAEKFKNFNELIEINANFVKRLNDTKIPLVHISTGCLYDQRGKGKLSENSFLSAHCNYTLSKWLGENYVNTERNIILRPRLLFGGIKCRNRNNLLQKLPNFNTFLNEFNSVTSCETIVHATISLLKYNQRGIFNVANDGTYTISDIAESIGLNTTNKITQEELHKSQNLYLVNNVMDISKLKQFYKPKDTIEEITIRYNELTTTTRRRSI